MKTDELGRCQMNVQVVSGKACGWSSDGDFGT